MNRLKVVIVEDEYYVRKGIINSFDWGELDCEVVGEAANGKKGSEIIEELRPDIVITDIEMPVMDGIEMVRLLKNKRIEAGYIFLTAHQKFTYVHSALKLEAVDYLLKPFRYEDLKNSIEKVREKLQSGSSLSQEKIEIEKEIQAKNNYIKEAVLYVRNNYGKDISNITAAEYLDINSAYFCRLFKKETGYTFGQYLTHYRVNVAAGLLANFDIRVAEVAEQVGYTDSNYFSQIFKKIMGITPKEYQNEKKYIGFEHI